MVPWDEGYRFLGTSGFSYRIRSPQHHLHNLEPRKEDADMWKVFYVVLGSVLGPKGSVLGPRGPKCVTYSPFGWVR